MEPGYYDRSKRSPLIQKKHKDCFHLKEHDEGVGDGKADAEDEYEEVNDKHLV